MKKQLRTSIDIYAPAQKVWDILMNFEEYRIWNPFVKNILGRTTPGSRILVTLQLPGRKAMDISPIVVTHEGHTHFAWKGKMLVKGLFDGKHHFELQVLKDGHCRFLHYEFFSGLLIPLFKQMLEVDTRAAFENMNQKLKERAEKD